MPRGGQNKLSHDQWVSAATAAHAGRYTYERAVYIDSKTKVEITCSVHGSFWQSPSHHTRGVGCPKCKGSKIREARQLDSAEFVRRARATHGDRYDYSEVVYLGQKQKVNIRCQQHGVFSQLPQGHTLGRGCPDCAAVARAEASRSRRTAFSAFEARARAVHGDKYTYSEDSFVGSGGAVEVLCPTHGVFRQSVALHLAGSGCPACANIAKAARLTLSEGEVAERLRAARLPGITAGTFTRVADKAEFVCPNHGPYWSRVRDALYKGAGCPRCGNKVSRGEDEVATYLRTLGHRVVQSSRSIIPPKELDVYLPDITLALEYNGLYYHSDLFPDARRRHKDKQQAAAAAGVRLVHLFEDEWLHRRPAVEAALAALTGKAKKLGGARNYTVTSHSANLDSIRGFIEATHLQGAPRGGRAYVLGPLNRPVAAMVFSQITSERGVRSGSGWELTRFCSAGSVPGAASRLFSAFVADHSPERVISYSDNRWFGGGMYKVLGFQRVAETPPNYTVVVGGRRMHKANFKKSKLRSLLGDAFDVSKTERAMCHDAGWYRVFDCGLTKWEWSGKIATVASVSRG